MIIWTITFNLDVAFRSDLLDAIFIIIIIIIAMIIVLISALLQGCYPIYRVT